MHFAGKIRSFEGFRRLFAGFLLLACFFGFAPASYSQGNLIVNGGFETLAGAGWLGTYGWGIIQGLPAFEGRSMGEVWSRGNSSVGMGMYQEIPTTVGNRYELRFSLLSGAGTMGEQSPPGADPIKILWGNLYAGQYVNRSATTWQSFWVRLRAQSAVTELSFECIGGHAQYIDAISLTAIPEPSTVLLLGIGGVLMMVHHCFAKHRIAVSKQR